MGIGKVYFVGAGPGHPGLITLRGVECLRRADSVLYDYLANPLILSNVSEHAELVCLGRHRRSDVWSQEAINQEMVRRASAGECVVRLKGGDPMTFGRAAEELGTLADHAIPFEIVPGITAASAAAAYAGITVTDRGHASALALVTGHERQGKPESALDYQALANFPGTLAFYMGVKTAEVWSGALLKAGKAPETPVRLIRRCSWSDQQQIETTLGSVAEVLTPYQKFPPPVVAIVGQAAQTNPAFDWFSRLPLLGQSILVSRPIQQAQSMMDRLTEMGAHAIPGPAISIEAPTDWRAVDAVIDRIAEFDWLVFSSSNGVRYFLRRILEREKDVRCLGGARIATIGSRTSFALKEFGLRADLQPHTYRAEELAAALAEEVENQRCLLLRASRGREVLAETLRAHKAIVEQVVVYNSLDVTEVSADLEEQWKSIDWVTVTSSAIARSLSRLWGERLGEKKLASISPITSATLRECGHEPCVEATEYTADGVIDAIRQAHADSVA